MKLVFRNQDLQMFGLNSEVKQIWLIFIRLTLCPVARSTTSSEWKLLIIIC